MKKLLLTIYLLCISCSLIYAQFSASFNYVPQAGAVYCFIFNQTPYFAAVQIVAEDVNGNTSSWNAKINGGTSVQIGPANGWNWEPNETVTVYYDDNGGTHSLSWRYTPKNNPSFKGTYEDDYGGRKCSHNTGNGRYCDCPGFVSQHWDASKCAKCGHPAREHTR